MKSSYCHSKNLLPKCNVANIYTNIKHTNTYVCEYDQIVISYFEYLLLQLYIHVCICIDNEVHVLAFE